MFPLMGVDFYWFKLTGGGYILYTGDAFKLTLSLAGAIFEIKGNSKDLSEEGIPLKGGNMRGICHN